MSELICFLARRKSLISLFLILQADICSLTTVRTGRARHCGGFVTETLVTLAPLRLLHPGLGGFLLGQLPQFRLDQTLHGEREVGLLRMVRVVPRTSLNQATIHHHLTQQTTEYKATTNGNLKIHIAAKHKGKRFHCDLCDWTSSQAGAVSIHKRQKHDVKYI